MIEIHFQNSDFVLAIKPAGFLSVPSRFAEKDERPVLGRVLEEQLQCRLFPVHRLDFEVGGLILFAKNPNAHRVANQWFEQKKIQKTYQALTTGIAPAEKSKFEWKAQVLRGKKRAYESPVGKNSLTLAEFEGFDGDYLLWTLNPVTGRAHQLRFDLSRNGFPIVGDTLYGSTIALAAEGIALQAVKIQFPKEALQFGLQEIYQVERRMNLSAK